MLSLRKVYCGYESGKMVLEDINLEVQRGEMTGIIGPNGSGKTTLLRAVSRVLKLEKGSIYLNGRDIWKMKPREVARKIAVVSQRVPEEPLTVEEFVLMGRIPHFRGFQFFETKHDIEVAERYMELTGVINLRKKILNEISGGERQLTLIARALTQEPELLLLDEPTTYLDIAHQVKVLNMLRRFSHTLKLTILIVLHDLNMASEYCDKLVLLWNGRLYKQGTPEEVLNYETIEEVYGTVVVVHKNPISKKPFVFPVPEHEIKKDS